MSRGAAVLALVLATIYAGWPTPAFGRGHGGGGHFGRGMSTAARAMAHPLASRRAGGGIVVTRPAPPFRHAPTGNAIIIEQTPVFFVHPFFFRHRFFTFGHPFFFGQPFFFRHRFFSFGQPLFLGGSPGIVINAPPSVTAPFFCWIDRIGFTDEERFAHHLHEVHGVPLDEALSASEQVDGRYVFYGY